MKLSFEHRLSFDREALRGHAALIGVDEAGRGPLAGPVVAAAVRLADDFYSQAKRMDLLEKFADSKKLTSAMRERLMLAMIQWQGEGRIAFAVEEGSVDEIDKLNILGATRLAMQRTLEALKVKEDEQILVDGRPLKPFPFSHTAVVKGDDKSLAIAMASVVAKVTRDHLMVELDEQFPGYGFSKHKGYGTKAHREAIRKLGACPEHRSLFLRKIM